MATSYDFTVYQGSELDIQLSVTDEAGSALNLSGFDVRGSVKYRYGDTSALLDLNPVVVSGSNGDGYVSGLVDVFISGVQTKTLPVTEAIYDIERFHSGLGSASPSVIKLLNGKFKIYPEVTTANF
tara:strand:+ start:213 stop:590 length:378 start_codon:yes stop_codon:yes gene_type:complete